VDGKLLGDVRFGQERKRLPKKYQRQTEMQQCTITQMICERVRRGSDKRYFDLYQILCNVRLDILSSSAQCRKQEILLIPTSSN
jgi:hypothetical protein